MKKLLASIVFAIGLSPAFASPEWQPFFTCDPGTGGTCSYTVTISVTMPTGSYTTNSIYLNDGIRPLIQADKTQYTKTTSLTLKDGSGNSMCSSPFTGTSDTGTVFGTSETIYKYSITCGSTGLTGNNTYTLTATGTVTDTTGNSSTAGPYLFVAWVLN